MDVKDLSDCIVIVKWGSPNNTRRYVKMATGMISKNLTKIGALDVIKKLRNVYPQSIFKMKKLSDIFYGIHGTNVPKALIIKNRY